MACPAGKYCLGATQHPITCPAGYFCGDNTVDPSPCPIGSYGPKTGLKFTTGGGSDDESCLACPAGHYCAEPGLAVPTGKCDAGYLCTSGQSDPSPTGSECPAGGYCELGSENKKACPGGTFNPDVGGSSVFNCKQCTLGSYCQGSDSQTVTGPCSDGYYCEAGSTVPT